MISVRHRFGSTVGLALIAVVVLTAGCTTTIRKHPDFHSRIGGVTSVGVMPPEVEFIEVVFKGDNERLRDEEATIREALPSLLVQYIGELDLVAREVKLDEGVFVELPELRFEASLVQNDHMSAAGEMYKTLQAPTAEANSQLLTPP